MKKIVAILLIIIIVAIGLFLFLPGDETKIRAAVKKGTIAVEEEDLSKIMSIFSIEYRDQYGLPYGAVRSGFNDLFTRFDDIQIQYSITNLVTDVDTSRLVVAVNATAAASGIRQEIVGDEYEAGRLELTFIKKYYKWLIISSEWQNLEAVKGVNPVPYLPQYQ